MSENSCRICVGGAEPDKPLFSLCKCSGLLAFVHHDCMSAWQQQHQNRCERGTPIRFGAPPNFYDRIQWKYNVDYIRYLVNTYGSTVLWAVRWILAASIGTHLAVASVSRIGRLDLPSEIFQKAFWWQLTDPWFVAHGLSAMFFKGLGEALVFIGLVFATINCTEDGFDSGDVVPKDATQPYMIDGKRQRNRFLVLTSAQIFAPFQGDGETHESLVEFVDEMIEDFTEIYGMILKLTGMAFVGTMVYVNCCSGLFAGLRWLILTLFKLLTPGETPSAWVAKLDDWSTLGPRSFLQDVALGLPVIPIMMHVISYPSDHGLKPLKSHIPDLTNNRTAFVATTASLVVVPYLYGTTLYYAATGIITNPGLSTPLGSAFWLVGGAYAMDLERAFERLGAMFRRMKFGEDGHWYYETVWKTKSLSSYLFRTVTQFTQHTLVLCSVAWAVRRILGLMALKLNPDVAAALFRPLDLTLPSLNTGNLRWIMLTVSTLLTPIAPSQPPLAFLALHWMLDRVWLRATTLVVRGMSRAEVLPQPDVPADYVEPSPRTNEDIGRRQYGPNWAARKLLLLVRGCTLLTVLGIAPLLVSRAGYFVVYGEHMAPDILLWATGLALELPVVGWLLLKTQPLELKYSRWFQNCQAARHRHAGRDRVDSVLAALAFVIARFCLPLAWTKVSMTWAVPNLIFRVMASKWPVEWYACALPLFLVVNMREATMLQLLGMLMLSKDLYLPQEVIIRLIESP